MDIPVYLFTGFMDSGKTSLITQTLQENDFGIGSRSLIIACEDGDEEYDEEALEKNKITVVGVESEEEFTEEYLKDCDETIKPDQVFIEYNGTWEAAKILEILSISFLIFLTFYVKYTRLSSGSSAFTTSFAYRTGPFPRYSFANSLWICAVT